MPVARQSVRELEYQAATNSNRFVPDSELEAVLPKHLSPLQRGQLRAVLSQYNQVFLPDIGLIPGAPYDLQLTDETPICLRPYPIPHSLLERAKATVEKHVRSGTLTPILDSEWATPTFFVPKPNGDLQMVTDFRKLNAVTVRHPHLLPCMEEIFRNLEGFDYVSIMDLNEGFYHFGLTQRTK